MAGHNSLLGGGGFHHVAIKVADFDKTVHMYVTALGFKEKIRWGEGDSRGIMLDTGDGNYLEIFAGGPKIPYVPTTPMYSHGPIIHFAIRTTDVAGATARAVAAGFVQTVAPKQAVIPSSPHATPIEISFVQGPDGEMVEFFANELT